MTRKSLAIGSISLVILLLVMGYALSSTGQFHDEPPSLAPLGEGPITVAAVPFGPPLYYFEGGKWAGFFAEALEQAPIGGREWLAIPLANQDAIAAVNAQSVDSALIGAVRNYESVMLSGSEPLLSNEVSLFAPIESTGHQPWQGQRIAWFGPPGLASALLRLQAEPVTSASAAECLTRAAQRELAACAIDETVGREQVSTLGLEDELTILGESIATLDYMLVWRPENKALARAIVPWQEKLASTDLLVVLKRKWLGTRIVTPSLASSSALTLILSVALTVVGAIAFVLGALNHSLRRSMQRQSLEWDNTEQEYRAMVEQANDAVFVLEPEQGDILRVNQRAVELTGYDQAELETMRFQQLLPARHRRILREWLLDSTDPGSIEEVPLVCRDGSVATVEVSSKITEGSRRRVRLCLVRNITERKLMQRELQRVTQLAERILENMTNGVITVDTDGTITSCNRALVELLRTGRGMVGDDIDEAFPMRGDSLKSLIELAIKTGETQSRDLTLLDARGDEIPASVNVSLLREEQAVMGAILVITKVSDDQSLMAEKQRLAMLSSLGQMSGIIAHDIRSKVTGVHVGVQYLSELFPPQDPRRESMEFIRTETDRVLEIIDDILMLIRPGRLSRSTCYIQDVVENIRNNQAVKAQANGVKLEASYRKDLPPVNGDAVQLERALNNLVKNAIEAMPNGGHARVILDVVGGSNGSSNKQLRIRVADDGPGIPIAIRNKLFQPFVTEKHGGTGLGLSIAKRIIDDHAGSIEVQSTEGQGTTFEIRLPALLQ